MGLFFLALLVLTAVNSDADPYEYVIDCASRNYAESVAYCEGKGGDIASFHSNSDIDLIKDSISCNAYIGAEKIGYCQENAITGASGTPFEDILPFEMDAFVWYDRTNKVTSYPNYLDGGYFIQHCCKCFGEGSVLSVSVSGAATVYIAVESNRNGGFTTSLPNNGWTSEDGQVTYSNNPLQNIYSYQKSSAGTITLPATTTAQTVMMIIVVSNCEGADGVWQWHDGSDWWAYDQNNGLSNKDENLVAWHTDGMWHNFGTYSSVAYKTDETWTRNVLDGSDSLGVVCKVPKQGCTYPSASNFRSDAVIDDGSCQFPIPGCTDAAASNFNNEATEDDGSCKVGGCKYPHAKNFDPLAEEDDGSCIFDVELIPTSCGQSSMGWDGSCENVYDKVTNHGAYDGAYCAHTLNGELGSDHGVAINTEYIYLDLGATYNLKEIGIVGRSNCCPEQSTNMLVSVGTELGTDGGVSNTNCGTVTSTEGDFVNIPCEATGRYVTISHPGLLVLCEIEIYGHV